MVNKGSEFYNRSIKSRFYDNNVKMCSIYYEQKSADAQNFFTLLKNKIYKYMTVISKKLYTDKSDDVVDKYNKIYRVFQYNRDSSTWS